jgi:hypothetical protein
MFLMNLPLGLIRDMLKCHKQGQSAKMPKPGGKRDVIRTVVHIHVIPAGVAALASAGALWLTGDQQGNISIALVTTLRILFGISVAIILVTGARHFWKMSLKKFLQDNVSW